MNRRSLARILFAACASGSGKTTLTCAFLSALKYKGVRAVAFKCGPDYIDPMFHESVLETKSRSLDLFMLGDEAVRRVLDKNTGEAELAVIEGVMGYYDGLGGVSCESSTYDLACVTDTPVVLIVNCRGLSVSAVAQIKGFLEYKSDSHIKGVILNRIAPSIYERIKSQIENELGICVFGYMPYMKECTIESRHLGLKTAAEIDGLAEMTKKLGEEFSKTVDVDALIKLAQSAAPCEKTGFTLPAFKKANARVAIARDQAFCFYYQDSLDLLSELGIEWAVFSPLNDEKLPENIDGLFIGGGYPELSAKKLSSNRELLRQIKSKIEAGMPVYAECGGFMYLHEFLQGEDEHMYPMAGVIKGTCRNTGRLARFGYCSLEAKRDTMICRSAQRIRAHEFHYWDSDNSGDAFRALKPYQDSVWDCIYAHGRIFAGFPHLHFYGNTEFAHNLAAVYASYKEERTKGLKI